VPELSKRGALLDKVIAKIKGAVFYSHCGFYLSVAMSFAM